jgi:outer membrane lipoprotein-sorting protein
MNTRWLSLVLLLVLPVAAAAQTVDEIVNKVIEARGGLQRIKAVKSERVSGSVTLAPDTDGAFVVELKRALKMRMEISVEGQKIIRVYDGQANGWVYNPFGGNKTVQPMEDADVKGIADEADFDGPLVDYKAKGTSIEFVGKEEFYDKPVYRLKLTSKAGEVRFYIFDASTYLLAKWEGTRTSGGEELPWQTLFSDYHDVNGLKYAFHTEAGSPGTNIKQVVSIDKIEIDPQIDDAHFAKPALPAPAASPSASRSPAPGSSRSRISVEPSRAQGPPVSVCL